MTLTARTQQVPYHGTIYTIDDHGITDGRPETVTERLAHTPREKHPMNPHLQAAIAIAENPDIDVNTMPIDQQIALGNLHALIALTQLTALTTPGKPNSSQPQPGPGQITITLPDHVTHNRLRNILNHLPQTEALAGIRPLLQSVEAAINNNEPTAIEQGEQGRGQGQRQA